MDNEAAKQKAETRMTVLTDKLILTDGRALDFDMLFFEHYDRVYGLLFRLMGTRSEAEDIAQEVFLKLYRKPPKPPANVGAWLYRVATNAGYNAIRSRKRRWERDTILLNDGIDSAEPHKQLEVKQDVQAVRRALVTLKPQQVQLLLLRQMGFSYAELAEACDLNPNSVGQTLKRASAAFRAAYLIETQGQKDV